MSLQSLHRVELGAALGLARRLWVGYLASLAAVTLVSLLIAFVLQHQHLANISMLYLIAVLAMAIAFGRGPAIMASVAAFFTFNYFFIQPVHTFTIGDPGEWIALLLFLITAGATGQLTAGLRLRADVAKQRERESTVLYDVVRIMAEPALGEALHSVTVRLRDELALAAVAIELEDAPGAATSAFAGDNEAVAIIKQVTRHGSRLVMNDPSPCSEASARQKRWVHVVAPHPPSTGLPREAERLQLIPIKLGERQVGKLMMVRQSKARELTSADYRLLSAVTMQLALAVERVRLQREATENEILRRTDEAKSALLNAVSHDLRTPLSSIIASAASLKQRNITWTDDEREELASAIEEEALRLNRIVGNLLDLSRIEGGSLRPAKDWYDLGTLVDEVLGRMRSLTANHHVSTRITDDLPPLYLDYVEIDQVITNLIDNATKYTPPGTEIAVSARRLRDRVVVEVSDRGPGLTPESMPHLFEPFYQAQANGPRPRGTGVGLAVAKGLIEAHGGAVWAENRAGGGARFVFTLPLTSAQDVAQPEALK